MVRKAIILILILGCALAGYTVWQVRAQRIRAAFSSKRVVKQLVGSEELILELGKKLKLLSKSALNLRLPDQESLQIFADQVVVTGNLTATSSTPGETQLTISPDAEQNNAKQNLKLWQSLFDNLDYFENAKFYFIKGRFLDSDRQLFETNVGFNGLAISDSSQLTSIHVDLVLHWKLVANDDWRIVEIRHQSVQQLNEENLYFRDVIDQIGIEKELVHRLKNSEHDRIISKLVKGGDYFLPPGVTYSFFFPDVTLEHPGVSVVDIDGDGFDDLFCAMQHGRSLLFRNRGDGTFEEAAEKLNLKIDGDATCAAFADFDNDGDPDLLVGRGRHPAMYFMNFDGRFADVSSSLPKAALPSLVSSISVTDFNNDGMLDAYFSTYSPIESAEFGTTKRPLWVDTFLNKADAEKYLEVSKNMHSFLNRTGPPNILLKNTGNGQFEISEHNDSLELWQMTFQSCWTDIDDDGDPDVYVANDYGPDRFFQNNGDDGFEEITKASGLTGMGFGMGISFGDFNNDGAQDAYVTNMYSKAGQRITEQFADLDSRLIEMASGNFLYRNNGGKFELVSGSKDSPFKVSKAGWSWGGQFIDFNNDGFRDIYASSGYYTAPQDVAVDVDL